MKKYQEKTLHMEHGISILKTVLSSALNYKFFKFSISFKM